MKVLFISYFFPPIGGGGVIRVTKFVKYLPQFGWKPYVLTVKKGLYPVEDRSLLKEIPRSVKVTRMSYFEPGFWLRSRLWRSVLSYLIYPLFLIPDAQVLWFLPAVITGWKIIKKEKIKIIFTSSAPASDHLIGLVLKKLTGVKWVADFRDEWTNNPFRKYSTPIHYYLNCFLEKKVVKNADQVITVSNPITKYLKNLSHNKEKFSTITNGFDEEDFRDLRSSESKIFRLIHVGSLYSLKYQESFSQSFRELNLKNAHLTFLGGEIRLPHKQAVNKMIETDALLLILDPVERPAVLTGKLFEYLRAQKPILALAYKNSEAAKIITKYQVGEVVEPNSEAFKKGVLKMYQKWQKKQLKIPKANIDQYERKYLTQNLTNIFDKCQKKSKIKLCLIGNIQSPQNQNLCRYFISKDYQVHFISIKPGKIAGVKTYNLRSSSFTLWYFVKSLLKIKKIIKQIEPDIVHGQDLVFAGIWAYLSGFHPYAVTPWGSDVMNYYRFINSEKYLIKKTLQQADLVTVSSMALQRQSEGIGLAKNTAQAIHFGIDLNVFKKSGQSQRNLIFCPRAIGPIYNTDILILAFAKILQKNKSLKLALLENFPSEEYLLKIEKLIIKLNLVDKVEFWPKVSNQKMAHYYHQAEVVVSLSSSDGCSVSFLEAMAAEKKIVVTDLPYLQEWQKNHNFWTVPTRNIEKTTTAILAALKYPQAKWKKVGQTNRQMVAEIAEINSNFEKLDQLYKDLL